MSYQTCKEKGINNYLFSFSSQKQVIATPGTYQQITSNNTPIIDGWTHSGSTGSFVCNQTGLYLIDYRITPGEDMSGVNSTVVSRALIDAVEVTGSKIIQYIEPDAGADPFTVSTSFMSEIEASETLTFEFTMNALDALIITSPLGGVYTSPSFSVTIARIK